MIAENKPVIIDGGNHGANVHAHEPGSDQARFMEKLREAAKSTADNIGRVSKPSPQVVDAKAEKTPRCRTFSTVSHLKIQIDKALDQNF